MVVGVDANVVTLIAGLGGTALGGAIAALAGWWQAKRQRSWQLEDFERQQRQTIGMYSVMSHFRLDSRTTSRITSQGLTS